MRSFGVFINFQISFFSTIKRQRKPALLSIYTKLVHSTVNEINELSRLWPLNGPTQWCHSSNTNKHTEFVCYLFVSLAAGDFWRSLAPRGQTHGIDSDKNQYNSHKKVDCSIRSSAGIKQLSAWQEQSVASFHKLGMRRFMTGQISFYLVLIRQYLVLWRACFPIEFY